MDLTARNAYNRCKNIVAYARESTIVALLRLIIGSDKTLRVLSKSVIASDRALDALSEAIITSDRALKDAAERIDKEGLRRWLDRIEQPATDDMVNVGANVREAWIEAKAKTLPDGSKVLDAGAGQCPYRKYFAHCDYRTHDFARYEGTASGVLKERWDYGELDYVCDITAIPEPDGFFEAVICTEVLEHVPDPINTLRELCRLVGPGGRLFLTAPLGSGLHQEPYHFYGGFTPHFYRKFLSDFGCDIVELKPINGLMKTVGQEVYRVGRVLHGTSHDFASIVAVFVLMNWLPRYLARMEKEMLIEEFPVGYLVEARKIRAGSPG